MNIELTPEQVKFIERVLASRQYGSVEEVWTQVWVIGMKEIEKQIALETELRRLREIWDQDMTRVSHNDADTVREQLEFVKSIEQVRGRSKCLRECFGDLTD